MDPIAWNFIQSNDLSKVQLLKLCVATLTDVFGMTPSGIKLNLSTLLLANPLSLSLSPLLHPGINSYYQYLLSSLSRSGERQLSKWQIIFLKDSFDGNLNQNLQDIYNLNSG